MRTNVPLINDLLIRVIRAASIVWAWLREHPLMWSGACLAVALFSFTGFEISIIPGMGFWVDELFTFWAGDPRLSFAEAFSKRILPDSNAPIYFSLIYLVQAAGFEGRAAFVVLNFIAIGSLLALIIQRGWRTGTLATAMTAVAIILVSGPMLAYAPEGRVYGLSMGICAVLAFYGGGVVVGEQAGRRELVLSAIFAVLAAWTHVFAAIFAGSLGVALIALGCLVLKRRDLIVLGLTIGVATTLAMIVWLAFALPLFTGTTSWTTFTPRDVFNALWTFKELMAGPTLAMLAGAAFIGLSLLMKRSRAISLVLVITGGLFFVIPLLISLKMPMFVGRYLLVAAPAMLVLMVFVLRSHLVDRAPAPAWRKLAPALGALFFSASTTQGMSSAATAIAARHDWRGHQAVLQAADQCPEGEIRTLFSYPQQFGFEYYLRGKLTPVPANTAPGRDIATIDCAVHGWAEVYTHPVHGSDWHKTADLAQVLDAFNLTNGTNLPLHIARHEGGLVLMHQDAVPR